MIRRWLTRLLVAVAVFMSATPAAAADDEQRQLQQLAEAAKGQSLALVVHGVEGHEATVQAFQRRFPQVHVELTVQNPSSMAPRIVTEQKNGVYAWDSWWAASTAMNNIVLPAGGFANISDYLVLPGIRDMRNWYAPDYHFSSSRQPFIILHSLHVETGVILNSAVIKGFHLRTAKDLLDPRLKGLIAIRDPTSGTTNGSYVLAQLLKENGPDFLRRLIIDQDPAIIENARQLNDAVLRGDFAVSLGSSPDVLSRCHKLGGCRSVEAVPTGRASKSTSGNGPETRAPGPTACAVTSRPTPRM